MALSVVVGDNVFSVSPGGFVRTDVTLANAGDGAVRVSLRVAGPAAKYSWVVPPEADLGPGGEATMSLGFRLPKGVEPPAGDLAWELVASTGAGPDGDSHATAPVEVKVAGTLTVLPVHDVVVELDPPDARSSDPDEHSVVIENRGNVPATTAMEASCDDGVEVRLGSTEVHTEPGQRAKVPLTLAVRARPLLQPRQFDYTVTAWPAGAGPVTFNGTFDHPARYSPKAAAFAILAVVVLAFCLRLTVFAPGNGSTEVSAGVAGRRSGTTLALSGGTHGAEHGSDCPAADHRDTRVTGLTPEDIPTLPADFSFFQVASDRCSPVRWNPCHDIHFAINPANAPPTGVADVREAFKRLAEVTGMTYVDDGTTDEVNVRNRAFQPDRYPNRWAPILVHWITGTNRAGSGDVQIVGGGFPFRVGDVYVSGDLFLNVSAIVNPDTRAPVPGGFADQNSIGAIGSEGVTWGRIILHELAHITGLGHVREPSQLMYPEMADHTGSTAFHDGDLAGLEYLGKDAGCLETPRPSAAANPQLVRGSGTGAGRP